MSEETANSANSAENTAANLRTPALWAFDAAVAVAYDFKSRLAAAEAERDALRDRDREWFESVNRKLLIHQEFAKMRADGPEVSFAHSHAAKILQQVLDDMENLHAKQHGGNQ